MMSKRRSPWSNNCPLQLKSHIGLREVADGVNGMFYRNHIHNRTKELLLFGAKQYYSNAISDEDIENVEGNAGGCDVDSKQPTIVTFFNKTSVKSKPDGLSKIESGNEPAECDRPCATRSHPCCGSDTSNNATLRPPIASKTSSN